MPADIAFLRKHYHSLSDDALLDLDRDELTEEAQQVYDAELKERHLTARLTSDYGPESDDEDADTDAPRILGHKPDWADDAATAYSVLRRDQVPSTDASDAENALADAGIPSFASAEKGEEEGTEIVSVMVPSNLVMYAMSVLDKAFFNAEAEENWKVYFENLSDEELAEADTKQLFCGLLDRLARLNKAFEDEKSSRGI